MAFTFTNYAAIKPRKSPLHDILGNILSGYAGVTQAKYMPRQQEADIFHKTVSPLAMLASSPFFSAMAPQTQRQIADYVGQMLSHNPAGLGMHGGGMPQNMQQEMPMQGGGMPQNMQQEMPMQGGGQIPMMQSGQQPQQPQQPLQAQGYNEQPGDFPEPPQSGEVENGLVPNDPSKHFTQPFAETGYTGGKVHRDEQGNIVSTPTGTQVEKQQGILSGSTKIGKLYGQYEKMGKKLANVGEISHDMSSLAGAIGKYNNPAAQWISKKLGGGEIANKFAKFNQLRAQMHSAFKELGMSDADVNQILQIRGGESGEAFVKRLEDTKNYINSLGGGSKNILGGGFNLNNQRSIIPGMPNVKTNELAKKVSEKVKGQSESTADAEHTAKIFNTTAKKVTEAQKAGVKNAKQFREWLKEHG